MAGAQDPNEGLVMSQVFIQRTLQPDGTDLMIYSAVDGDGGKLPLVEALGLLELAKSGLLTDAPCCCENGHEVVATDVERVENDGEE